MIEPFNPKTFSLHGGIKVFYSYVRAERVRRWQYRSVLSNMSNYMNRSKGRSNDFNQKTSGWKKLDAWWYIYWGSEMLHLIW